MLLVTKFKQFNAESSSGDEVKLIVSETEIVLSQNSNSMLLVTKFKQFNAESSSGDEVKLIVSETEIVLSPH